MGTFIILLFESIQDRCNSGFKISTPVSPSLHTCHALLEPDLKLGQSGVSSIKLRTSRIRFRDICLLKVTTPMIKIYFPNIVLKYNLIICYLPTWSYGNHITAEPVFRF